MPKQCEGPALNRVEVWLLSRPGVFLLQWLFYNAIALQPQLEVIVKTTNKDE